MALSARSLLAGAGLAVALTVGFAARARAWTETELGPLDVTVDVQPDARAAVSMTLGVGVLGGWLEAVELAGLDADLVLDEEHPPYAVTADGRKPPVYARVRPGGHVVLRFPDGHQPRRGRLIVGLRYFTRVDHWPMHPHGSERIVVRWQMPPFHMGVERATLSMVVPHAERSGPRVFTGELDDRFGTVTRTRGALDVTTWRRVHLPRNSVWQASLSVDERAMEERLREQRAPAPAPARATPPPLVLPPRVVGVAALLLALLPALKVLAARRRARKNGLRPHPLLRFPESLRPFAAAVAFGGGAALATMWLLPGIGLCVLATGLALFHTPRPRPPAADPGRWRNATRKDLRRAAWTLRAAAFAPSTLLDATTLPGILLQLALLFGSVWLALEPLSTANVTLQALPLLLALALGPLFWTATRRHVPTSPLARLRWARDVARGLRFTESGPPIAVALRVHESGDQTIDDARLELVPASGPAALLRCDVALGQRSARHGYESSPVLVLHVQRGAERVLSTCEGVTMCRGDRERVVVVVPCGLTEIPARVAALLQRLETVPSASSLSASPALRQVAARSAMTMLLSSA